MLLSILHSNERQTLPSGVRTHDRLTFGGTWEKVVAAVKRTSKGQRG